jgi:hypothetical protein
MSEKFVYDIGTPGKVWGDTEKAIWFKKQCIKRSYNDEVLAKLTPLKQSFDITQYGALGIDEPRYPLYAIKSKKWQADKKTILVTGGVHGYETSGVQGAIRFAETKALEYAKCFNVIVVPCVSPWGYETINRWNAQAIDPNRSFYESSPAQESALLIDFIKSIEQDVYLHIDLHETTDTDNSEFRPALAARDAVTHDNWNIPDGFYSVADSTKPEAEFQAAVIAGVSKVTHIAPADDEGRLIGNKIEQLGVINYAARELGLCMGLTDATYVTTTEVYPDSPTADDESCIIAQVAAITSALDYVRNS